MILDEALAHVSKACLDSSLLIYYVEANPKYIERARLVFNAIQQGSFSAVTSAITITEVFNKPLQQVDIPTLRAYGELLFRSKQLALVPVTPLLSYRAARLRATYNLRTPDAIQVATALVSRCDAFLTNDIALKRVTDLRVLVLDELETT